MFAKGSTRWLLLAIVVLAAIWLLSDKFSTRAQQRTFREEVIMLDTTSVSRISARSTKTGPEGVVMEQRADAWVAVANGKEYRVDNAAVHKILAEFARLKADHLIGNGDAVRAAYNLTDSAATQLEFTTADGAVALWVGKESYGKQGAAQTAVCVPGEEQVFGVAAILTSIRDLSLNALRPHVLVTGDPVNWQRVTFTFPADSGYVLERTGGQWMVDTLMADSMKVANFVKSLALSRAQNFADTVDVASMTPKYELKVEDSSKPEPILVKVYPFGFTYLVTSTANPGNVMWFDPAREFPRLLRPRHNWLQGQAVPLTVMH